MKSCQIDLLLARAQVALAFLIALGFLTVLGLLLLHGTTLSPQAITIVTGLLSVLGTILTLQMNYFFARHRPEALPEPAIEGLAPIDSPPMPAVTPAPTQPAQPAPSKVNP